MADDMTDVDDVTDAEGVQAPGAELAEPTEETTTAPSAEPGAAARPTTTGSSGRPNARKVRDGLVTSNAMQKTAVVAVTSRVRHQRYQKTMARTTKLFVHDEANDLRVGDRVRVQETRPLSKQKRWRLLEVLERAK